MKKTPTKKRLVSAEESALFRAAIGDICPLKISPKIIKPRLPKLPSANKDEKKHTKHTIIETSFFEGYPLETVSAETRLFYAIPGLSYRSLKKFKRGQIEQQAVLDLHGETINSAREALSKFMQDAQLYRLRCVRIIHGKSRRQGNQATKEAILKNHINHWLKQHPAVLAFCSAQPKEGGNGALYLLLRRS